MGVKQVADASGPGELREVLLGGSDSPEGLRAAHAMVGHL